MDKKVKIIIAIVIVIIAVGLFMNLSKKDSKVGSKANNEIKKTGTVDMSEIFEIDNIEENAYGTEKNEKCKVASKYSVGRNMYEAKSYVEFRETTGKMIYVREDYNKLNIYQTEYKLDKYENINSQVEQIIEEFDNMCREYLRLDPDAKAKSEELYGEAS